MIQCITAENVGVRFNVPIQWPLNVKIETEFKSHTLWERANVVF